MTCVAFIVSKITIHQSTKQFYVFTPMYGTLYVVVQDAIVRGTQPQFRYTKKLSFGNFGTFGPKFRIFIQINTKY